MHSADRMPLSPKLQQSHNFLSLFLVCVANLNQRHTSSEFWGLDTFVQRSDGMRQICPQQDG